MITPEADTRSPERRALDEQIADQPHLPFPELPSDACSLPLEAHLRRRRRPLAVAGVVENGLIRPLDPSIKLLERSQVIIVTVEPT